MSKLELSHILGSSTAKPQQLAFAQDCFLYVSGSFVIFYNPVVDEQISYLKHTSPLITCIAVSPCEKYLAICSTPCSDKQKTFDSLSKKNNSISIYGLGQVGVNEPAINIILKGHKFASDHAVFSPDSKYLVTVCNKDGSMFVWDCSSGERLTQNKNSKAINSIKFVQENSIVNKKSGNSLASLVTCGRGNCKIWPFYSAESSGSISRVNQQQHWILVGRTIPLNKKFATKEFIDVCFWQAYILLLTSDGLLCLVSRTPKQQKLQKCIDLMITKTTSMDIYQNTVMCGGDNALIKVVDLDTLTLVRKFPKPPPTNKQNISKDCEDQQMLMEYEQSEEFPQCTGIKTIGNNKFSQFIVTLYDNLTMFIWRPQPQDIIAMRSIITHKSSIKSVTILQEFKNDLTFFSTISQDNTLRIWHIYKKCFYNRESIDIAELIGIRRNAYCRNLTRIIYMESEKQVTCIAGFCKKSVACIAHREFIMYSLANFEVVCHQVLDCAAVALEIKDNVAYIGLQNCKVIMYQILEQEDRLNKIRQIEFENKIKYMKVISDDSSRSFEALLLILTLDSDEVILYSLKKSKIIHVEKGVKCCSAAGHHIVMCKSDQTISIYNILKGKSSQLLSLKHEIGGEVQQQITHVSCNLLWIVVATSNNKLIVANFSSAIVCTEQFAESINDMALSDSGEIILVGDYGDILIYRMQGNHAYSGMEEEVKKWMEKNDMSWMEGSVWAKKKSNVESDRQLSGSVVDSIRLRSSVNNRGSLQVVEELPNVQIKYKTEKNDESVFNPSDILKQAKQIYKQIDGMEKKINNSNAIVYPQINNQGKKKQQDDDLQQIMISRNINKKKPPIIPNQSQNEPLRPNNSKKRIFGLSLASQSKQLTQTNTQKSEDQNEEGMPAQYKNNLVHSIVHSDNAVESKGKQQSKQKQIKVASDQAKRPEIISKGLAPNKNVLNNFSQFMQDGRRSNLKQNSVARETGQLSEVFDQYQLPERQREKQVMRVLEKKLASKEFITNNSKELQNIYRTLDAIYGEQRKTHKNQNQLIIRAQVLDKFSKLSNEFIKFLSIEGSSHDAQN